MFPWRTVGMHTPSYSSNAKGVFTNFLKFWETFPNFGKFWEILGNFGKLWKFGEIWEIFGKFWEILGAWFGKYYSEYSLRRDHDWAPARYFSHGARTITDWRSLSLAIIYYNCVSRGHCAIIERFQVITRRLTGWTRAARCQTQSHDTVNICASCWQMMRTMCRILKVA